MRAVTHTHIFMHPLYVAWPHTYIGHISRKVEYSGDDSSVCSSSKTALSILEKFRERSDTTIRYDVFI